MGFTTSIDDVTYFGDKKIVLGRIYFDGVATGELDLSAHFTGKIINVTLGQQQGKTTPASELPIVMNETFPLDSGTAITCNAYDGAKAMFEAKGYGP